MSPEALPHLDRARRFLRQARAAVGGASWEVVAFAAYTAAFHAAQVLIFERAQLTMKTHNGVKSELNRLARLAPAMDPSLVAQFGQAESTRRHAVYGHDELPDTAALETLTWAERFVAEVERVLSAP